MTRVVTSWERLEAEQEALRSLMELLEQVKKCQRLYERANMALPEPLKRVLGTYGASKEELGLSSHIPPPKRPPLPDRASPDWIAIDVQNAMPANIALAILADAEKPLRAKEIADRVAKILPDVNSGSIANMGTRFANDGIIERTEDGWKIVEKDIAGVLSGDLLWGPRSIFSSHELAAHRRDSILHLLSFFEAGLQTSQIIEQLQKCPWVQAPVNKELVGCP